MKPSSVVTVTVFHIMDAQTKIASRRFKLKQKLLLLGPAFIISIGYIDPGNYATNLQAGSNFGYDLLWVVLWANIIAMLIQYLSAKLGIVTGKNLSEQLGDRLPKWAVWPYWIQAEIVVIATDLAEFIGAAVGFKLVFGLPLMMGAVIAGVVTVVLLMINNSRRHTQKPLEIFVAAILLLVAGIYIIEMFWTHPDPHLLMKGLIIPTMHSANEVYLAAGILGATVMPHVIYLHSALFKNDYNVPKHVRLRSTKQDIIVALTIAGFVNIAIVVMAAAVFHFSGHSNISSIDTAYRTIEPLVGKSAAVLFGVSLIASGLSSSIVGTLAGEVVMQGFVKFRIPVALRRAITMIPSFLVIYFGVNATTILVLSQVILSFGIALALVPLLMFTNNKEMMGEFVNSKRISQLGVVIVAIVLALNIYLLFVSF